MEQAVRLLRCADSPASSRVSHHPDRPTILSRDDRLHGYLALLNSSLFFAVFDFFSPLAAPGQYSLEPTYIGEVPIPDFERLCEEQRSTAHAAFELAMLGRDPQTEDP